MAVRLAVVVVSILLSITVAEAQQAEQPNIHAGDTWTYRDTHESKAAWNQTNDKLEVDHTGPTTIAVESKQVDSSRPPSTFMLGADWNRTRDVNGHQTVVNRPLAFPLTLGKTWTVDYTENHPNRAHLREQLKTTYKVVGWDSVSVPAGTFHAIKIEAEGEWTADVAPGAVAIVGMRTDEQGSKFAGGTTKIAARTASGNTYKAFWYAPEVKRWVKSIEEYYGSDGIRNERYTSELEAYKVSN